MPSFADVPKLVYTGMILSESMRLYPPAYILVRTALNEDRLPSGAKIPAGADIFMCQYVAHRNPRYFPDPERFDPERFNPVAGQERSDYAYFLLGADRECASASRSPGWKGCCSSPQSLNASR